MAAQVKVVPRPVTFGGWKGRMEIDGAVLHIVGDDPNNRLDVDCSGVKRFSFNSMNGLWALRMVDGRKLHVQMSGQLLSADRSPAGKEATQAVGELLRKSAGEGFSI